LAGNLHGEALQWNLLTAKESGLGLSKFGE
jgi:hypothetical protein